MDTCTPVFSFVPSEKAQYSAWKSLSSIWGNDSIAARGGALRCDPAWHVRVAYLCDLYFLLQQNNYSPKIQSNYIAGLHCALLSNQPSGFQTIASQFCPFSSRLIKTTPLTCVQSDGLSMKTPALHTLSARLRLRPPGVSLLCSSLPTFFCFAALVSLHLLCCSSSTRCFLWIPAATFKSLPTVGVCRVAIGSQTRPSTVNSHTWFDKGQPLILGCIALPGYWSRR